MNEKADNANGTDRGAFAWSLNQTTVRVPDGLMISAQRDPSLAEFATVRFAGVRDMGSLRCRVAVSYSLSPGRATGPRKSVVSWDAKHEDPVSKQSYWHLHSEVNGQEAERVCTLLTTLRGQGPFASSCGKPAWDAMELWADQHRWEEHKKEAAGRMKNMRLFDSYGCVVDTGEFTPGERMAHAHVSDEALVFTRYGWAVMIGDLLGDVGPRTERFWREC